MPTQPCFEGINESQKDKFLQISFLIIRNMMGQNLKDFLQKKDFLLVTSRAHLW